ncbi:MAG: hypothetical protein MRY59_04915 [Aquisalinus sp.]|nr:hypothetical protein [Aquisalinus sp.]
MLTVAEVELPVSLQKRLREEANFAETFTQFTREHLIGFRQPMAIAAAIVGPVLFAFVYQVAGFLTLMEVAVSFSLTAVMFLLGGWYVNRRRIREMYVRQTRARKDAQVDLKTGKGEAITLTMKNQPLFYEHEHGVICLADAGEGKTVYFDVDSLEEDPRWFLYINGDMHRVNWSWIRLKGSGAVADFSASGQRLARIGDTPYVEAPDAWEAICVALNEPQDGDIVDRPLDEVKETISRLL